PAAENDLAFYPVEKLPFVPNVRRDRAERCMGIFEMQVLGLKKRMDITRSRPIIGVSGGLDSTLALLV
ncbi:MAG TPA: NAD(+) synthase, partial [Subdoligranulum sp.]|nr:NAD(+) synthase [Subdoligranulum sp.]